MSPQGRGCPEGPASPRAWQQARGGWEVRRDPLPDFSVPSPLEPSQEGAGRPAGKQGHPPGAWALQPEVSLATAGLFLWRRHWSCLLSCAGQGRLLGTRVLPLPQSSSLATPRTAAHQTPPSPACSLSPQRGCPGQSLTEPGPSPGGEAAPSLSGLQLLGLSKWNWLGPPVFGLQALAPTWGHAPPPPGSQSCWLPPGRSGPPAKPGLLGEATCLPPEGTRQGKQVVPRSPS